MSPVLKAIAGVLDTPAMSPDARIAHVAELKGEEAGKDVSVFMKQVRNPAGNLDLSGDDDEDNMVGGDAGVAPYLEVPRRGFGMARDGWGRSWEGI